MLMKNPSKQKILRLNASNVAAICGYNPFVNPVQLFIDHVYQDRIKVLQKDAEILGLQMENREQKMVRRLECVGGKDQQLLQSVRKRARDGSTTRTVEDAAKLRGEAKAAIQRAISDKKLASQEGKEMLGELESEVNTKFGKRGENVAIKLYEKQTGCEVYGRNDRYMRWEFPFDREKVPVPNSDWILLSQETEHEQAPQYTSEQYKDKKNLFYQLFNELRKIENRYSKLEQEVKNAASSEVKFPNLACHSPKPISSEQETIRCILDEMLQKICQQDLNSYESALQVSLGTSKNRIDSFIGEDCEIHVLGILREEMFDQVEDNKSRVEEHILQAVASVADRAGVMLCMQEEGVEVFGTLERWEWSLLRRVARTMKIPFTKIKDDSPHSAELLLHLFQEEYSKRQQEHKADNTAKIHLCKPVTPNWEKLNPVDENKNLGADKGGEIIDLTDEGAEPECIEQNIPIPGNLIARQSSMCDDLTSFPYFVIVGMVDGICDQLDASSSDPEDWIVKQVVVEVKNRMRGIKDPPPLYDQIQSFIYMKMLGCDATDLVQYVRDGEQETVHIYRVDQNAPPYHHQKNWDSLLITRLYQFVAGVYKFQQENELRWKWLSETPEAQYDMLCQICPYFCTNEKC